ncbi:ladderlectin isoform X2 [Fundulus heteroclitus]|uniref:ladderlectin isoform X2 n=2 Tax=Fundulus heteroclitus TaxID=8078 RepID=UPI00165C912A|nr:ladderlectin isoform X2 [Fundulus heteroclitus]
MKLLALNQMTVPLIQINNRCFHYVSRIMSWARAKRNCLSMGANLASVHDTNEYRQVQSLITKATYKSGRTWIGGTNAQETSIWFWSDRSPLHYTNWCPGKPRNAHGTQRCLQMNYSDKKCWDDYICSVRLPSVCANKVR